MTAFMLGCALVATVLTAVLCYQFLGAKSFLGDRKGKGILSMLGANSGENYSAFGQQRYDAQGANSGENLTAFGQMRYDAQGSNSGENLSAATQRLGLLGTNESGIMTDAAADSADFDMGTYNTGKQDSSSFTSLADAYGDSYDPNAIYAEMPDMRVAAPAYAGAFDDDKTTLADAYGGAYKAGPEPAITGVVGQELAPGAALAPGYGRKPQGVEVISYDNSSGFIRPAASMW